MPARHFTIETLADDVLLLRLGDARAHDAAGRLALNARVHACVAQLQAGPPPWLQDIVPAFDTLALFFDLRRIETACVVEWIEEVLSAWAATADGLDAGRIIDIPVRYGGADGPDLDAVAAHAGLTPDDAIELHSAAFYAVAMIGFAPGFPYLSGMDARLATPRLVTPRTHVPAGSIGIGGAQTGIYPRDSPGGWNLIGRTDAVLFDPAAASPSLLQPGDRVRFVPVPA